MAVHAGKIQVEHYEIRQWLLAVPALGEQIERLGALGCDRQDGLCANVLQHFDRQPHVWRAVFDEEHLQRRIGDGHGYSGTAGKVK